MTPFSSSRFEKIFSSLAKRFPLPTLLALLIAGIGFYMVYTEREDIYLVQIILSSLVTFLLSVGITLVTEGEKNTKMHFLYQIIAIVYGVCFYFFYKVSDSWPLDAIIVFLLHGVGFFTLLFSAPFLRDILSQKQKEEEYSNYFVRVAWNFTMSAIVGCSTLFLGFIALGSIDALFDLNSVPFSKLYGYWLVVAGALVTPLYFLVEFPRRSEIVKNAYETNVYFSFLVRYIAIPFIFVYFVILYAYSVKVLLNFSVWPNGEISWMVIGFSIFGYLAYVFSRAYESGYSTVGMFRKYFPIFVLPQLAMLAYAIGIRIGQYDLTVNRYLVVLFGVWLLIISLYFIVSKRRSLAIIPTTLTIITLLFSIGPWSITALPLDRQYTRLMENFERAGMVQGGMIVPASTGSLDANISSEIYSGIEYVCSYEQCEKIIALFPDQVEALRTQGEEDFNDLKNDTFREERTYDGPSQWEIVNAVTNYIRISYNRFPQYIVFSTYTSSTPIDVTGYETLLSLYGEDQGGEGYESYVIVDTTKNSFVLKQAGEIYGPYSLADFYQQLLEKYPNGDGDIDESDLSYEMETPEFYIKFLFNTYTVTDEYSDSMGGGWVDGFALIRMK